MIPEYRIQQIRELYNVFPFETEHLSQRKQEFKRVLRVHYKWAKESELDAFYNIVYDKELSIECKKHAREIVITLQPDVLDLFGRFDQNKDGAIEYYEFTHGDEHVQDLFRAIDVNKDGQISIEEFVSFIAAHPEVVETLKTHIARSKQLASDKRINELATLFKKFPFSPTTPGAGWRPCLSALHSPVTLHRKCLASSAFPKAD